MQGFVRKALPHVKFMTRQPELDGRGNEIVSSSQKEKHQLVFFANADSELTRAWKSQNA